VWTGGTIYASDSQSKGGCMLTRSTMKPATPHARQDTRAGLKRSVTRRMYRHIETELEKRTIPDYRRYRVPGGCYFFTVNLLERRGNDLLIRHIDFLRDAVRLVRRSRPFTIDAWVVLPDHLHCVWTLPPETMTSRPAGA